jgi:hypothetical protein
MLQDFIFEVVRVAEKGCLQNPERSLLLDKTNGRSWLLEAGEWVPVKLIDHPTAEKYSKPEGNTLGGGRDR